MRRVIILQVSLLKELGGRKGGESIRNGTVVESLLTFSPGSHSSADA